MRIKIITMTLVIKMTVMMMMMSRKRSEWMLPLRGRITYRHCQQPKLPNFLYSSNTTSWRLMRRANNNNMSRKMRRRNLVCVQFINNPKRGTVMRYIVWIWITLSRIVIYKYIYIYIYIYIYTIKWSSLDYLFKFITKSEFSFFCSLFLHTYANYYYYIIIIIIILLLLLLYYYNYYYYYNNHFKIL